MTSIDWINVLSYILAVENLKFNEEQVRMLEEHLLSQDKQYEEIKQLLTSLKEE